MFEKRSGNPVLNDKTFRSNAIGATSGRMTLSGTANKSAALFVILLVSATWVWNQFMHVGPSAVMPWMIGGLVVGLILALVTVFKPQWAMITAPMYAAAEGLAIGGLSAQMEVKYEGIVIQAVALTLCTFAALLMAYKTRLIKPTENFKLGVAAATGGIALFYLVSIGLKMFGITIPLVHEGGVVGICVSLFIVTIAALNLVLDFDFIEQGCDKGAPKHMEWYASFGLMVTLLWLYVEILNLLAKMRK